MDLGIANPPWLDPLQHLGRHRQAAPLEAVRGRDRNIHVFGGQIRSQPKFPPNGGEGLVRDMGTPKISGKSTVGW